MKSWIQYTNEDIKKEIESRRAVIREYAALLKKGSISRVQADRITLNAHNVIDDARAELDWRKTEMNTRAIYAENDGSPDEIANGEAVWH